ncbi:SDR family NAD(P)-dependent oxidoreductase, partial [Stutzerimonas balearica]|uniref:SDR family NAD(P)-dependent oxidoreductase n=1 Tax=Stutzerimonas balearica TaxID=74829 RepID=UPI0028A58AF3
MNALDYRGRTLVLTGAAGGIGQGLAHAFAEAGARLELIDRDGAALDRLRAALPEGVQARAVVLDLGDLAAVQAYADDLAAQELTVDVLINNAGVEYPTPLGEASAQADRRWAELLDNNVASMQRLTRALLPRLAAGASVINQASIWGLKGVPGF